jgi:integrase
MARAIDNPKITTRSARSKLPVRPEPFWTVISTGCAIGYRKGKKGGTWIARMREGTQQHYESLGAADDSRDPDGLTVFSFTQAQERAREFFTRKAREIAGHIEASDGPYTVAMAIDDYLAARERRGSSGVRADRYASAARITPELGKIEVSRLTAKRISTWHAHVADAPKFRRTKAGALERVTEPVDRSDSEAVRARCSTANRLLTILKAALNHAFQEGKVGSDEPWRRVKPFRAADSAVFRYLNPAESLGLANACEPPFRALVHGALMTGCRYGELVRLRVSDFDAEAGTVVIRQSKSGKPRHVTLNDEGWQVFADLVRSRAPAELIFVRPDGKPWGASHQQRPLIAASKSAAIDPPVTFHILRHTYASALAMKGVPMGVIAKQLGHSDTRMTERHYAHLSPSYIADMVRAALPAYGIMPIEVAS